jgi:hypothetical protein
MDVAAYKAAVLAAVSDAAGPGRAAEFKRWLDAQTCTIDSGALCAQARPVRLTLLGAHLVTTVCNVQRMRAGVAKGGHCSARNRTCATPASCSAATRGGIQRVALAALGAQTRVAADRGRRCQPQRHVLLAGPPGQRPVICFKRTSP